MQPKANAVLSLWPGTIPGPAPKTSGPEADLSKPNEGLTGGKTVIRLGNVAHPEVHVFLPPKQKSNGTAVVICPGGGFYILAWDLEGTEIAQWLNSLGVAAIVVKYRVPTGQASPAYLGPAMDAQRAVSLTRSKAAEWGISPDRIGILGFSAGGATAGVAALQNGKRLYDASDDTDRASCRPDFAALIYPAYFVDDKGQLKSEFAPPKDVPPFFFVHAFDDGVTCQSSLQLAAALKQSGGSAELHLYDTGGHGYGMRPQEGKPVTGWTKRCADWLERRGLLKR